MEYYFSLWKNGELTHMYAELDVAFKKAKEGGYHLVRIRVTEEGVVHLFTVYQPS
jgi:hypothetical protein